jgi:hypothetical protein
MSLAFDAHHQRYGSDNRVLLRRTILTFAATVALLLAFSASASAETAPIAPLPSMTEGWTRVVSRGFTDPGNSHVAFTAEFMGHLYASTMASQASTLISGSKKLGSDIWRTADGVTWEQIGTPGLGDPTNIMFDLVVYKGQLYALSLCAGGDGFEIWATPDGKKFAQLEEGGFGDPKNTRAVPMVIDGRLVLAVANSETGVQIWVTEDGRSFRQVPVEELNVPGNIGAIRSAHPEDPGPVLQGKLYVGITNATSGGEIWRTADGLEWERVADNGLGVAQRHSLHPWLVYKDQLYVVGGYLNYAAGFDLFRSSDGSKWEQVVENGFGAGEHRNRDADLVEFDGRLYLVTLNEDPRVLVPGNTMERFAPEGFQLWVSDDGSDWSQVGKDGFGRETSFMADIGVHGGALHLEAIDYKMGNQIWRSAEGQNWEMIFHEPPRSFFNYGMGNYAFQGHYLFMSNDLEGGVDIWRSNEAIVAEAPTTLTPDESSTSTVPSGTETTVAEGRQTAGHDEASASGQQEPSANEKDEEAAAEEAMSSGILALIIALAVVAVTAIGVAAYLWGRSRAGGHHDGAASVATSPSTPSFCSQCGSSLTSSSQYCPGCGRKL